jgi:hypothetical protein
VLQAVSSTAAVDKAIKNSFFILTSLWLYFRIFAIQFKQSFDRRQKYEKVNL